MKALCILVAREESTKGFPFTAYVAGVDARGVGKDVAAAVEDMFTSLPIALAVQAFEQDKQK